MIGTAAKAVEDSDDVKINDATRIIKQFLINMPAAAL